MTNQKGNRSPGRFVLSLDFELHWGVFDSQKFEAYRDNLLGARHIIPVLLQLFSAYQVRCTWAVVGFLCFSGYTTAGQASPLVKPTYVQPELDSYRLLEQLVGQDEGSDPFHFAPSLIKQIATTPGQELATHTFSHYYCQAEGQTKEQFRADLNAAIAALGQFTLKPCSIVFPRNMCGYLDECQRLGLSVYRSEPVGWMFDPDPQVSFKLLRRLFKWVDSYVNLTGSNSWVDGPSVRGMKNVRASRFLRPVAQNRWLKSWEGLRFYRIKKSMTIAARMGAVYHLWWHPHNFGVLQQENTDFLKRILDHYVSLRDRYAFTSACMADFR